MKLVREILFCTALLLSNSVYSVTDNIYPSGSLEFINNTATEISVTVNGVKGVPIGVNGLTLKYSLIAFICVKNKTNCHTEYSANGQYLGYADLNANTGELIEYAYSEGYKVVVDESEVPLRTVTFSLDNIL